MPSSISSPVTSAFLEYQSLYLLGKSCYSISALQNCVKVLWHRMITSAKPFIERYVYWCDTLIFRRYCACIGNIPWYIFRQYCLPFGSTVNCRTINKRLAWLHKYDRNGKFVIRKILLNNINLVNINNQWILNLIYL